MIDRLSDDNVDELVPHDDPAVVEGMCRPAELRDAESGIRDLPTPSGRS